MATIELVNHPADGSGFDGHLHASEVENLLRGINGQGVRAHTYSATVTGTNMIVTIPAISADIPDGSGGTTRVTYAGGDITIDASDPTNPRTDFIFLNASGTCDSTMGVATAEIGDVEEAPMGNLGAAEIMLAKVRVGNGVTVIGTDKVWGRAVDISKNATASWVLAGSNTTEATMTSATAADLVTISGLSIPATTPVTIITNYRKSANAFQPSIGLKVNSTVVIEASLTTVTRIGGFSTDAEVQNGLSVVYLGPRRANYDKGISGYYSAGGVGGNQTATIPGAAIAAAIPIATITDIIIRGDSDGTNTLGVHGVYVYTGPV